MFDYLQCRLHNVFSETVSELLKGHCIIQYSIHECNHGQHLYVELKHCIVADYYILGRFLFSLEELFLRRLFGKPNEGLTIQFSTIRIN